MAESSSLVAALESAALSGDLHARLALADLHEEGGDGGGSSFWRTSAESGISGRLDALPSQAERLIPVVRDYWLSVGLRHSGRTPNAEEKAAARASVCAAYEIAGFSAPTVFVWLDGPLHGSIGAVILAQVWDQVGAQVWAQVRDQVRAQVGDQVRDQVWAQVGDQVRAQVWDQVGAQVGAQVRAQVGDQVRDQVRDQVWAQVRDQVWAQVGAQVGDQVGDQVYRCGYGSQDAGWLSFYAFFDLIGIPYCAKLRPLMDLAKLCGWWWPFENAVILSRLPTALEMRDGKLKHVKYADGLEVIPK